MPHTSAQNGVILSIISILLCASIHCIQLTLLMRTSFKIKQFESFPQAIENLLGSKMKKITQSFILFFTLGTITGI